MLSSWTITENGSTLHQGRLEYRKPLKLDDESLSNIILHTVSYASVESEFKFSPGVMKMINIKDVVTSVKLIVQDNGNYVLDEGNEIALSDLIKSKKRTTSK